ncbi:hypothetical protein RRG08_054265 [Elysia crispata]|uniref:Uncharacterized protein n=1 Tax=Elysia crispata TaxID=231223 RepID=A0AAE0YCC9_9GAST|nr:hypothetical protein RRG08_054265 [Elysia crispata]
MLICFRYLEMSHIAKNFESSAYKDHSIIQDRNEGIGVSSRESPLILENVRPHLCQECILHHVFAALQRPVCPVMLLLRVQESVAPLCYIKYPIKEKDWSILLTRDNSY